MNFLKLINKCLIELNYRQVNSFNELIKNDHKKIKDVMNIINNEICSLENWNFLLRRTEITIPANESEIDNTINGRILYIIINGEKYKYCENFEPFLTGHAKTGTYSVLNNKLLFTKNDSARTAEIIYYTNNSTVDSENNEKNIMENATDTPLIPMPFVQPLLVYGTCMRLKGNPQHIRFSYWASMYKDALLNLKSKASAYAKQTPRVILFRD